MKIYPTARVRDGFDETSDHSHSGDQNRGLGSENRGLKKMADFAPPPLRNFKFSDLWKLFVGNVITDLHLEILLVQLL